MADAFDLVFDDDKLHVICLFCGESVGEVESLDLTQDDLIDIVEAANIRSGKHLCKADLDYQQSVKMSTTTTSGTGGMFIQTGTGTFVIGGAVPEPTSPTAKKKPSKTPLYASDPVPLPDNSVVFDDYTPHCNYCGKKASTPHDDGTIRTISMCSMCWNNICLEGGCMDNHTCKDENEDNENDDECGCDECQPCDNCGNTIADCECCSECGYYECECNHDD